MPLKHRIWSNAVSLYPPYEAAKRIPILHGDQPGTQHQQRLIQRNYDKGIQHKASLALTNKQNKKHSDRQQHTKNYDNF